MSSILFYLLFLSFFLQFAAVGFLLQVVDLGAADFHLLYQFNFCDVWGVEREDLFDFPAFARLEDTERAGGARATGGQDGSFEDLNTFALLSFWRNVFNFLVHFDDHSGLHVQALFLGHKIMTVTARQRTVADFP